MKNRKILIFFKDLENKMLLGVSFLLALNTLFFIGREISWLEKLPLLPIKMIYIDYFILLLTHLAIMAYIFRRPVNLINITKKLIFFLLPSALLLLWGLSVSIHFNQFFRSVDYLFFIFILFFVIYRYKKYPKIRDFAKDIFFWFKHDTTKTGQKFLAPLVLAVILAINLSFGLSSLTKHAAVDEPLWTQGRITKYWNNIADKEYQKTMISDKPGITVAIISGIGLNWVNPFDYKDLGVESTVTDDYKNINDMYLAMRLPIYLFCALSLFIFYGLLKYLLDKNIALLSVLFIGLSPILIGISNIINPDSLLWIFAPLTLVGYLCYLKNRENRFLYFSGIFLGLAVLTKYIANIFYVFFPILIFLEYVINKERYENKSIGSYISRSFLDYFILIFFSLVTVFIFLPAAWVNPSVIFQATLLSKAFLKVWIIFLVILGLISIDIFFLKSRVISYLLRVISLYRKAIIKTFYAIFLFFILMTLLDVYTGMKVYDLESILASPKSSYAVNNMFGLMLANFYSAVFGIIPVALFSVIFLIIYYLRKKDWLKSSADVCFYLLFFIFTYYSASIANDVSATVRYQIIIYPLIFIVSAIGLDQALKIKKIKKYFPPAFFYPLLLIFSLYSLFFIRPFYFSYASGLLPKQYVLNIKDMGDGSYEAAQYLNKLPNARKLVVWTDKRGVCAFFVGICRTGFDFDKQGTIFDYYIVSSGRQSRTSKMTLARVGGGNTTLFRLDKLYDVENPEYQIIIGNRPDNYVKIINIQNLKFN